MKTKNKVLAVVKIAIVLCSLFLVATLPVIAAEQNQEMQEIRASEVTTASEDDFVLGIYGNANEDDTIDMRDLTYVKLIFFGKKPETELADAKYDGKINPLDFIHIKLIIVGKEKELTVIDSIDRIVTVKKPLKRIVVTFRQALEPMRAIKVEKDRIVGVESLAHYPGYKKFFSEFISDVSSVGTIGDPDIEAILNLHPDVVLIHARSWGKQDIAQEKLESAGITVLRCLGCAFGGKSTSKEVKKFGYIFGKQDEAEEFLNFHNKYMNLVKETVEKISEDDKTNVYYEAVNRYTIYKPGANIEIAGGKDIFADHPGPWLSYLSVDPEAVIERNPDIIIKGVRSGGYHLDADDTTELKDLRGEIMSRPELQNVKAVKNGRVYVISGYVLGYGWASGCRYFLQVLYQAKWFHPDLFEDLDPKAIHQEYLTRFQGLDIDLDKKGVFVYPEEPN